MRPGGQCTPAEAEIRISSAGVGSGGSVIQAGGAHPDRGGQGRYSLRTQHQAAARSFRWVSRNTQHEAGADGRDDRLGDPPRKTIRASWPSAGGYQLRRGPFQGPRGSVTGSSGMNNRGIRRPAAGRWSGGGVAGGAAAVHQRRSPVRQRLRLVRQARGSNAKQGSTPPGCGQRQQCN